MADLQHNFLRFSKICNGFNPATLQLQLSKMYLTMTVIYFSSRQPEKLFETENLQNEVVSFWSVNMTVSTDNYHESFRVTCLPVTLS